MTGATLILPLPDEAATIALAARLAPLLRAGDLIALSGDLGAGKTTFARALIRTLAADPALDVPSPTFTLVQTYPEARLAVTHVDLYRIRDSDEIDELGLDDAVQDGIALVEWPERAGGTLPGTVLNLALAMAGTGREARLSGAGWGERLAALGFPP